MKRSNLRSKRGPSARRREAPLRVAVLIESSRAYGRGLLLGVAKYVHERSHWQVYSHERELQSTLPRWFDRWDGHGVIARIERPAMAKAIRRLRVPVVDLRRIGTGANLPALHTDEHVVVRLVLEHFLERGFRHFAFWGFAGADYSEHRQIILKAQLAARKTVLHVYSPTARAREGWTVEYEQLEPELEQNGVRWLQKLPKPIAVIACDDIAGQQVLEVCRLAELRVPDQVAVIGVDNDEVLLNIGFGSSKDLIISIIRSASCSNKENSNRLNRGTLQREVGRTDDRLARKSPAIQPGTIAWFNSLEMAEDGAAVGLKS